MNERRRPCTGFPPTSHPILVIATRRRTVISAGPNLSPSSARAGPRITRMSIPMIPPIHDDALAVINAWPGRFLTVAIGYPSTAVRTAGESPGMLRRIAENAPPYMLE